MPTDELTKPLGLTPRPVRKRRPFAYLAAAAVILVIAAGGTAFFATRGTGPTATATIAAATTAKPAAAVDTASRTASVPAPSTASIKPVTAGPPATKVAVSPGLTEVTPNGSLTDVGKVLIYDPAAPPPIALPATPDGSVLEPGNYGPLPKVAVNGLRPLDAYARPATPGKGAMIAIVVGGVGLDPDTTRAAIALPGAVTLGLVPYASNLTQTQTSARAGGHELLLQIPLEPYGYPTTDPGPHTLTIAAGAKSNMDDLSWLLSRTTNYVGVVNYMGAAFTSSPQQMATLLDAVGQRGLLYLDDGSSPRSIAADTSKGRGPFVQADMVVDPDLSPAAIDARLDQLIALARQRGFAVGTATAFPASIDRVAAFAKGLAAKGVTLVPISALASLAHS